jgi:thiamine phosphate synthase YjbQ (UPF0047 family)
MIMMCGWRSWRRMPDGAVSAQSDGGGQCGCAHEAADHGPREAVVAITKGKLDLGPWEQIFYGEFDSRRRKRVLVKIIGE